LFSNSGLKFTNFVQFFVFQIVRREYAKNIRILRPQTSVLLIPIVAGQAVKFFWIETLSKRVRKHSSYPLRFQRNLIKHTLGTFPSLSLSDTRKKANALTVEIENDFNPQEISRPRPEDVV
jgi:hypothetical protein